MSTKKGAKKVAKVSKTNAERAKMAGPSTKQEAIALGDKLVEAKGGAFLSDGFIVVGDVRVSGCERYVHSERAEKTVGDVGLASEWKTKKTVQDKIENEALHQLAGQIRRAISYYGTHVGSFHFVPISKVARLEEVLKDVDRKCKDFNMQAKCTSITPDYLIYRVSGNDARVAKAVYGRLIDACSNIERFLSEGNLQMARWWLQRMVTMEDSLPEASRTATTAALDAIRESAKEAVKKVKAAANADKEGTLKKLVSKINVSPVAGLRAKLVEVADEVERTVTALPTVPRFIE